MGDWYELIIRCGIPLFVFIVAQRFFGYHVFSALLSALYFVFHPLFSFHLNLFFNESFTLFLILGGSLVLFLILRFLGKRISFKKIYSDVLPAYPEPIGESVWFITISEHIQETGGLPVPHRCNRIALLGFMIGMAFFAVLIGALHFLLLSMWCFVFVITTFYTKNKNTMIAGNLILGIGGAIGLWQWQTAAFNFAGQFEEVFFVNFFVGVLSFVLLCLALTGFTLTMGRDFVYDSRTCVYGKVLPFLILLLGLTAWYGPWPFMWYAEPFFVIIAFHFFTSFFIDRIKEV